LFDSGVRYALRKPNPFYHFFEVDPSENSVDWGLLFFVGWVLPTIQSQVEQQECSTRSLTVEIMSGPGERILTLEDFYGNSFALPIQSLDPYRPAMQSGQPD
jgi:hypothetical protein